MVLRSMDESSACELFFALSTVWWQALKMRLWTWINSFRAQGAPVRNTHLVGTADLFNRLEQLAPHCSSLVYVLSLPGAVNEGFAIRVRNAEIDA